MSNQTTKSERINSLAREVSELRQDMYMRDASQRERQDIYMRQQREKREADNKLVIIGIYCFICGLIIGMKNEREKADPEDAS